MCGLVTIYSYRYNMPVVDRTELRSICNAMQSRGPDGSGEWFSSDGRVAMGHRRLAIIDPSPAGAQPMASADHRFVVTFNGEIYNYREIRERLEKQGKVFRSHSDTEVLLHLYEEKGEEMVSELRGMFAFALWDAEKKSLLLARDPYGIKPLYYADDGKTVRAASQVKALLAGGKISKAADPAGVAGFFLFGSVPEPFTFHRDIRAVPAGSLLRFDRHGPSGPKRYFSIPEIFREAQAVGCGITMSECQTVIRKALLDSVRHHLVSDVPVGIFLSAGVDSSALVGLARDAGIKDIRTLTLGFEEYRGTSGDEVPIAEETAKLFKTEHFTRWLHKNEFKAELPKILDAMDQPTIDGVNTYFISKAAHEAGLKVALSGLGGDEIFGGYSSFREIPAWVQALSLPSRIPFLPRLFRNLSPLFVYSAGLSPKATGLLEFGGNYPGAYFLRRGLFMPWELKEIMDKDMAAEGLRQLSPIPYLESILGSNSLGARAKITTLESSVYMRHQLLRDADWAGMVHSLEIRTPYVDGELFKTLAPLIASSRRFGKKELASAPSSALPERIQKRSKTGFVVPISNWLEKGSGLDEWRKVPVLAKPSTHWSRRWAYMVVEAQKQSA